MLINDKKILPLPLTLLSSPPSCHDNEEQGHHDQNGRNNGRVFSMTTSWWLFGFCLMNGGGGGSHYLMANARSDVCCRGVVVTEHTVNFDVVGDVTNADASELQRIAEQFVTAYISEALVGCLSRRGTSYAMVVTGTSVLSETRLSATMMEVCNGCTTKSLFSGGVTVPSAPPGCPFCDPPPFAKVLNKINISIGVLNDIGKISSITKVAAITQVFPSPPSAPFPITTTATPVIPVPFTTPPVLTSFFSSPATKNLVPPIAIDAELTTSLQAFPYVVDRTLFGSNIGNLGGSLFPIYTFCVTCDFQGPYDPRPSKVGQRYVGNRNGDDLRFTMVLDEILITDVQNKNNPTLFTNDVMDLIMANNVAADFVKATLVSSTTQVPAQVNAFIISYTRRHMMMSDNNKKNEESLVCNLLVVSNPTNLIPSSLSSGGYRGIPEHPTSTNNTNDCPNFVEEVQARQETTSPDKCPRNSIITINKTCVDDVSSRYMTASSVIADQNKQMAVILNTTVAQIIMNQLESSLSEYITCLFSSKQTASFCFGLSYTLLTSNMTNQIIMNKIILAHNLSQIDAGYTSLCASVRQEASNCFPCAPVGCTIDRAGRECCDNKDGRLSTTKCTNSAGCMTKGNPQFILSSWFVDDDNDDLDLTVTTSDGSIINSNNRRDHRQQLKGGQYGSHGGRHRHQYRYRNRHRDLQSSTLFSFQGNENFKFF